MQCTNNLKQIGLAVHNFHDARQGLPPACLVPYRMTIFPLLYPYLEQQSLYDLLCSTSDYYNNNTFSKGLTANCWWSKTSTVQLFGRAPLTDQQRQAYGSVSAYICPSRRSAPAFLNDPSDYSKRSVAQYYAGTQTDYAITQSSGTNGWRQFSTKDFTGVRGPFRIAKSNFQHDGIPRGRLFVVVLSLIFLASGCNSNVKFGGRVSFSDDDSPLTIGTVVFEKTATWRVAR